MRFLFLFLFLCTAHSLASEDNLIIKLRALNWKETPNNYSIANEKAIITTTQNDYLVIGKDAIEYMFLMQGHKKFKPDAAILRVQGPEADSQVIFTINKVGYLTKNDWDDNIDRVKMLREIKESTKESNKHRGEGYPNLYVDHWAQSPFLDKINNTVYWAISGHDDNQTNFINAKALKLGREGYTEILWVGSPKQFSSAELVFEPVLSNYNYKEGFQYEDYMPGSDKLAAAGIGALVYKLATGKTIAKAGFLALAAIFAKKLWFLVFLPFIYCWKWVKKKIMYRANE